MFGGLTEVSKIVHGSGQSFLQITREKYDRIYNDEEKTSNSHNVDWRTSAANCGVAQMLLDVMLGRFFSSITKQYEMMLF